MKKILLLFLIPIQLTVLGQKPPLDHSVYDTWKSISQSVISGDGHWVAFTVSPQDGDGWLYIFDVRSGKKDSVARGGSPSFSPGSDFIAFNILPESDVIRQAKKKKLKEASLKNEVSGLSLEDLLELEESVELSMKEFNEYMETEGRAFVAIGFDENDQPTILTAGSLDVFTTVGVLDYIKTKYLNML